MRVFAVLLVAVAACGPARIPRAEYAARAAQICADRDADITRIGGRANPESGEGIVRAAGASNERRRQAIDELVALGRPDADADVAEAMVSAMARSLAHLEASQEALTSGDPAGAVEAVREAGTAGAEARRHAEAFGIAPCAR